MQIARTGASNYIPQYLWDVITCPCPWYLLLTHTSSIMATEFDPLSCLQWHPSYHKVIQLVCFGYKWRGVWLGKAIKAVSFTPLTLNDIVKASFSKQFNSHIPSHTHAHTTPPTQFLQHDVIVGCNTEFEKIQNPVIENEKQISPGQMMGWR